MWRSIPINCTNQPIITYSLPRHLYTNQPEQVRQFTKNQDVLTCLPHRQKAASPDLQLYTSLLSFSDLFSTLAEACEPLVYQDDLISHFKNKFDRPPFSLATWWISMLIASNTALAIAASICYVQNASYSSRHVLHHGYESPQLSEGQSADPSYWALLRIARCCQCWRCKRSCYSAMIERSLSADQREANDYASTLNSIIVCTATIRYPPIHLTNSL